MAATDLTIGWKLTKQFEPEYWLKPDAAPGQHSPGNVIRASAAAMANHMVIVAQSGSGKSFFLGRVLEELLLKTRSRVVVFDPNSDFRKVAKTVSARFWTGRPSPTEKEGYGYDRDLRRGFLPDEASRESFAEKWDNIEKLIFSMHPDSGPQHKKLQIDWPNISIDILMDEMDTTVQTEAKHCHNFVQMVSELIILTKPEAVKKAQDFLDIAKELCQATRGRTEMEVGYHLKERFPVDRAQNKALPNVKWLKVLFEMAAVQSSAGRQNRVEELHHRAAVHRSFVSDATERFYFSTAYAVQQSGLLPDKISEAADVPDARLQVIDLPSIEDPRFRDLTVDALIELEWKRARRNWHDALRKASKDDDRVPTFIVVDEAHNLLPSHAETPTQKWLRERFRRVAAEGRKFGLFLILVSQRPDKLDAMVVSECENKAVMKIGTQSVLDTTVAILGLGDIANKAKECLEFDVGRALIVGPWAGEPAYVYGGARRTEEGGRNLRSDFWARAPEPPAKPAPPPPAPAAKTPAKPASSKPSAPPPPPKDGKNSSPPKEGL